MVNKSISNKPNLFYWGLYNFIIIPFLSIIKFILKFFNPKVRIRENNWKKIFDDISIKLDKSKLENQKVIWFHSASMGEFEQAKPIIELIKSSPETKDNIIIVTFFSPSGYENQKNYKFADYILYLPFDLLSNVSLFISTLQPDIAIFIRYDIWYNYLCYLNKRKIPTLLISATFSNSLNKTINKYINNKKTKISIFEFKINYYKEILNKIDYIFSATEEDFKKFEFLNLNNKLVRSGDTRIDRILKVVEENINNKLINKSIFNGKKVIIIGSSWLEEEKILSEITEKIKDFQIIIVPHEPNQEHINKTKELFDNLILFSELEKQIEENKVLLKDEIILIDSIGKLLNLYSIADFAIVGGGFRTGLHSVLEPAGYGLPIICGPKTDKQVDAIKLQKLGGLFIINDANELFNKINELNNNLILDNISKINKNYLYQNSGKSLEIYNKINFLLK